MDAGNSAGGPWHSHCPAQHMGHCRKYELMMSNEQTKNMFPVDRRETFLPLIQPRVACLRLPKTKAEEESPGFLSLPPALLGLSQLLGSSQPADKPIQPGVGKCPFFLLAITLHARGKHPSPSKYLLSSPAFTRPQAHPARRQACISLRPGFSET